MRRAGIFCALAMAVIGSGVTPAIAGGASVEAMASNCIICHGPAAAGQKAIPEMQDLTPAEIRTRLAEFKADQRPGTIMPKISKGYSDEAIEALAAHFGKKS